MDTEIWKPIVGYENIYEVSNQGNVRRINPLKSDGRKQYKGPNGPYTKKKGYPYVRLYKNDGGHDHMIHRLVMAAFVGPIPIAHEVNHKNGIRGDSRLENLEYVTHSENQLHAYRTLLVESRPGSKHHNAKVSEDDVFAIRALRKRGWKLKDLKKEFRLGASTICWICLNKAWRHI